MRLHAWRTDLIGLFGVRWVVGGRHANYSVAVVEGHGYSLVLPAAERHAVREHLVDSLMKELVLSKARAVHHFAHRARLGAEVPLAEIKVELLRFARRFLSLFPWILMPALDQSLSTAIPSKERKGRCCVAINSNGTIRSVINNVVYIRRSMTVRLCIRCFNNSVGILSNDCGCRSGQV